MREIIERFGNSKVLVIGDAMLDVYHFGQWKECADLIHQGSGIGFLEIDHRKKSCEWDRYIPIGSHRAFEQTGFEIRLGGAANVAANLKAMGANVTLWCAVSRFDDQFWGLIKRNHKLDHWFNMRSEGTTQKHRWVVDGKVVFRNDFDVQFEYKGDKQKFWFGEIESWIQRAKPEAIVLCDYHKGVITKELIQHVCLFGIPVICDPSVKKNLRDYDGVTYLLPNRKCMEKYYSEIQQGKFSAFELSKLSSKVIEKRDCEGAYFAGVKTKPFIKPEEVIDPCGAGDTFIAAFTMALIGQYQKLPHIPDAVKVAVYASGLACKEFGTTVVSKEKMLAGLPQQFSFHQPSQNFIPSEKRTPGEVFSRESAPTKCYATVQTGKPKYWDNWQLLKDELATLRNAGKKIVFVNGVFDILHPGHLYLLQQAKKQGDVLIVALNQDATVKKLKGKDRPLFGLAERIQKIALIPEVDYIVDFAEDHPLNTILELRPNVVVKGSEYRGKMLPEFQGYFTIDGQPKTRLFTQWNSHLPHTDQFVDVVFVDSLEGFRSSEIIDRIQEQLTKDRKPDESKLLVGE